ncbi:MAG: PKD domain-containing protein [Bacteroidota bacterium]|nr:PKD domain-containing protein [Bacteroidota bacterium]
MTSVIGLIALLTHGQVSQDLQVYPMDSELLPVYVEDTLYGDGGRMKFVSYEGSWDGIGAYKYGESIGLTKGLIISNGWVMKAVAPNSNGHDIHERDDLGGHQDEDMNQILAWIATGDPQAKPDSAIDASVLTFEFMPFYDQVQIKFLFASEEYKYHNLPEDKNDFIAVDSVKSDIMGIVMWDNPNQKSYELFRKGPNNLPVSVKYLNHKSSGWMSSQYVPNEKTLTNPDGYPVSFDAFSLPISDYIVENISPCRTYKIKIAVADNPYMLDLPNGQAAGPYFNSAVFVEAGSIKSGSGYGFGFKWDVEGMSDNAEFEPDEIVEGGCSNMMIRLTKTFVTPDTTWVRYKIQNGSAGEYSIMPPPKNDSVFAIPPDSLEITYVLTALQDGNPEGDYEYWTLRYQVDPCDFDQPGPIGTQGLSGEIPIKVYERDSITEANKTYGPVPASIYYCGNEINVNVDDILDGGVEPFTQFWQSSQASGFGPDFNVPIASNPEIVVCTIKDRCSDLDGYNTAHDTVFIHSQLVVSQETPNFQLCENLEQPISVINTNAGNDFSVNWYFQGDLVHSGNPYLVTWDDYVQYYDVLDSLVFEYTVNDECGNSANGSVVAFWDPIVQIQGPEVICLGEEINLNCSEGQSYQWYEGSVSPGNEIPGAVSSQYSFTPSQAGMYTICVEILNSCDELASTCYTFEVSELNCEIEVNGTDELVVCPNMEFQLEELNGFTGWEWSWFDDGSTHSASGKEVSLSLVDPGMHTITVSAYNEHGCYDERDFEIMVNPYTELQVLSEFDSVCVNTSVQLSTISAVDVMSWEWSSVPADPTLAGQENDANPLVSPSVQTTYYCFVTDENSCVEEQSKTIYIRPPIQGAMLTDPESVCAKEEVVIDFDGDASPGASYTWTFENGSPLSSNTKITTVVWNEAGWQDIQLDISEPGCEQSLDMQVLVNPKPSPAVIPSGNSGCQPLEVIFHNQSADLDDPEYSWDFGDGGSSSEESPVYVYDSAGLFDVNLTITNATGCDASETFQDMIEVFPTPQAGFDVNTQAATLDNPTISFFEQVNGEYSYLEWDFGDGATAENQENPEHTYNLPGVYQAVLFAENNYGCSSYDTLTITITTELKVYFPNAFTPNGDGNNDCFQVIGTVYDLLNNFTVHIHDRWGRVVHTGKVTDPDCLWDGTDEGGEVVPMGTYAFRLVGKDFKGEKRNFVGHINVIR